MPRYRKSLGQSFCAGELLRFRRGPKRVPCLPLILPSGISAAEQTGEPIYNLLGGRQRDRIPIYNTCVGYGNYAGDLGAGWTAMPAN